MNTWGGFGVVVVVVVVVVVEGSFGTVHVLSGDEGGVEGGREEAEDEGEDDSDDSDDELSSSDISSTESSSRTSRSENGKGRDSGSIVSAEGASEEEGGGCEGCGVVVGVCEGG